MSQPVKYMNGLIHQPNKIYRGLRKTISYLKKTNVKAYPFARVYCKNMQFELLSYFVKCSFTIAWKCYGFEKNRNGWCLYMSKKSTNVTKIDITSTAILNHCHMNFEMALQSLAKFIAWPLTACQKYLSHETNGMHIDHKLRIGFKEK